MPSAVKNNEIDERTKQEALAYLALGARMLGWQILVPKDENVDYVFMANERGAKRILNKLEALGRA